MDSMMDSSCTHFFAFWTTRRSLGRKAQLLHSAQGGGGWSGGVEQLVLHNLYLNCEKNAKALAAVCRLHMLWHIDLRGTCAGEVTVAQLFCSLPQLPRLRKLLLGINSLYGPANQARPPHMPRARARARLVRTSACLLSSEMHTNRCLRSRSYSARTSRKST